MRKAYHQVVGVRVRDIIRKGELYPALNHIAAFDFLERCADKVESFEERILYEDLPVFEEAHDALWRLLEREAQIIEDWQKREGIKGSSVHTNLTWVDFLAHDFDKVFMSTFHWAYPKDGASGFVFNADALINEGARIRPGDLIRHYQEAIKPILSKPPDGTDYETLFTEAVSKVLRDYEYSGPHATEFLDEAENAETEKPNPVPGDILEIIFEGPIPLEWAIEAWQDGKRVK